MLLYQRCIVTKLFKKTKTKTKKQNLGLYYRCILLALCFVLKRGILYRGVGKSLVQPVYSTYGLNMAAL